METFSVVILNYNGRHVIGDCLRGALALAWPELEIIVVDNASTDSSPEWIAEQFGDRIRVVRREVNSPTEGRNDGFRAARGRYVLSLDNDIVLSDPYVLHKAADILDEFPSVGALNFKIGSQEQPDAPLPEHWWHPVPLAQGKDRFLYTDWFAEGAVVFRAEALAATGGYDGELFHGYESVDLALRMLDRGFEMLYCPNLTCVEIRVRGYQHVARSRINYLTLRNKLWTAWKNYPLLRGLKYALLRIAVSGVRAARFGWLDLWLQAVRDGVFAPRTIRNKRKPLQPATWDLIRSIRRGRFCQMRESSAQIQTEVGQAR
jgi:GT2 family glycosyltransferase